MRFKLALLPAALPVVGLILALPFVNRLEPIVLGLPFVLFWILAWVAATPVCLAISYAIVRRSQSRGNGAGERR